VTVLQEVLNVNISCANVRAKRFNGGNNRCRLRDASFNLNFARQN
jgi:hypothetical protein